jgi:hypothetical protein
MLLYLDIVMNISGPSCSNLNWSWRDTCNVCQGAKPPSLAVNTYVVLSYIALFYFFLRRVQMKFEMELVVDLMKDKIGLLLLV